MDYYKKHQSLKNLSIRSEDFKDLSFRAMRVCRDNNFNSVSDIIVFIKKGGRLSNLKSCGKKTVLEIEELVKGRIENENLKLYDKLKEKYKKIRDDKWKKQLFDANFKSLLNNLSVRSRNGYILIVKNDQNGVDSFIDKVFFNNLDFESIRNMGKKSIIELEFFKKNIKSLIEDYSEKEINEFDLIIKNLENFLGFSFDEIESSEHKLIESIKNKEVDLIYFFDFYILNYYIKKDVDKFLLIKYLYPKNKEFNTNEQIAEKSGLTRERVRQKGVKVLNERRFYNLSNLIPLSLGISDKIKLDYYKVVIPENLTKKKLLYLDYNSHILTNILNLVLGDYSVLSLGEELKAIGRGKTYRYDLYKSNKKVKVNYVFSKEFINKDLCLEILNDVYHRFCYNIEEDYLYNPFLNFNLSTQQKDFINELVFENFNLSYNSEGILFKRNTFITLDELIEKVLKKADKPLLIEEIYERLESNYPGRCKSAEALRGTVARENDKFMFMRAAKGRKTLYGLFEWKKTKNLKGGSIKQLCIDYLESKSTPVHLLELSRFIMKNRETNPNNILSNLKLDPHDNFIYYKSRFIGLKKKKYDIKFINSIKFLGGVSSNKIFRFLKNNIYYDYKLIVEKYTKEFDVHPIQVEQIIMYGIENEVFNKKGDKVYYNSVQEDFIIKDLFKSEEDIKILGYNPYRVSFNDEKVVFKVIQSLNSNVNLLESYFNFDESVYEMGYFSKYRCLLIYNPSLSKYRVYLWNKNIDLDKTEMNFKFNDENDFSILNINTTTNIVDFTRNKTKKFLAFLNVLLDSEMRYDEFKIDGKSINLDYINIDNISELNAISKITSEALEKFNTEIDISDAREIYQRIKLSKN
jgi:hypothetical protein